MSSSAASLSVELEHPGGVGVGVDFFGRVFQLFVDGGDGAGDGRVEIADGLDAFDGAEDLAGFEGVADLGQIDEDDVAERALRVVGDADGAGGAVDGDPLVFLGVLVVGGVGHSAVLRSLCACLSSVAVGRVDISGSYLRGRL